MSLEHHIQQGLKKFELTSSCEPYLHYLQLLHKWNQAYNLTAVRDLPAMVSRHLLDSLAILPWIKGPHVIDVGTGPGLPGIPLALALPTSRIVLLDSQGKKIRFLREVQRALSLENVEIVQTRVENYHPERRFDTVVSRAFSDLEQFLTWTQHLIAPEGRWLAMKGKYPQTELAHLQHPYQVEAYAVDGLDSERCCVIVENIL